MSKVNASPVFNSHWCNFADMKPLLFLIGSTDQLDTDVPTVLRLFNFWLNASFRPRGKRKTTNTCALLCVWEGKVGGRALGPVCFFLRHGVRCGV